MTLGKGCPYRNMEFDYLINADEGPELNVKMSVRQAEGSFLKNYKRTLGHPGKHGIQGFCGDDLLCFEGQKVLEFPECCCFDRKVKIGKINIEILHSEKTYNYTFNNLDWFGLYDIRKKCFAIGNFDKFTLNDKIMLYMRDGGKQSCGQDGNKFVCEKILKLYNYYKNIFGDIRQNSYDIYFLNKADEKNIFAGAGLSSVGSTFDPESERDMELLSHRMFHAFFDSNLKNADLLAPPYLWLYEGLAVYNEIESLDNREENWRNLRKRYDYAKEKYKGKLELIPEREVSYINFGYKMEFLHYTQAPLIVKQNEKLGIIGMLQEGVDMQDIIGKMDTEIRKIGPGSGQVSEAAAEPDEKLKYFDHILESWGIKND